MTANSFGSRATLRVAETSYEIHRLDAVAGAADLPFSLKVLLENLLRTEDGRQRHRDHVTALAQWDPAAEPATEIQFSPARVILQDLTGVPAVVDLATMREAMQDAGRRPGEDQPAGPGRAGHRPLGDRRRVRPARRLRAQRRAGVPAATASGSSSCAGARTRCASSRWCRRAPASCTRSTSSTWPGCVIDRERRAAAAYPDTCVGTDSHTTMQNGLGVLGWGVGGIEAEAAMLGQPVSHADPAGGRLPADRRAAGRHHRHRPGADHHRDCCASTAWSASSSSSTATAWPRVPLANRATIGNMSPEFGSTCAIFPIDERDPRLPAAHRPRRTAQVALVEAYAKEQGLWHEPGARSPRTPRNSSSTWPPSSRRWPGRSGRRTGCR